MVLKPSSNDKINGIIFAISYFSTLALRTESFEANKQFYKGVLYGIPLVGVILALLTVLIYNILPFHPVYSALIASIIYLFMTGFLHFEGLADTIDGWYASYSSKDIYKVMHEPQVGSIGALGSVSFLILLISSMVYCLYLEQYLVLFTALLLSRTAVHFSLEFEFHEKSTFIQAMKENYEPHILMTLLLYPLKLLVNYILKTLQKRLGFLNGDTLGAMIVMVEIILINIILIFTV
ncbi:MAG: adenosylcobinamide-GDP ribazoletransferase [Campylobacterota bacterium]|nr:adenosylcobinamide-GDP ribazoletransferase [Campylobacterota bacterium]